MAQQRRMVYAKILGSHNLNSLPVEARYLYIGMIVLADDDGRLNGDPRFLKGQVFSYDEQITSEMVKEWRDKLAKLEQIKLYESENNEYISHPNWKEYQSIRSDMYVPSRIPKPKRDRNEPVTEMVHKLSKVKLNKDKLSKEIFPSNQVLSEFKNVKLTFEEIEKLYERLGKEQTLALIEELGAYLASSNKRYLSHYATLLNWSRRKKSEKNYRSKNVTAI